MAKKKGGNGIPCPGCAVNFDPEIHSPLVGSCGHSLCSVCANEKKMPTCPVCQNPGSFFWKKKNELATKLLSLLAKKEKKPKKVRKSRKSKKRKPTEDKTPKADEKKPNIEEKSEDMIPPILDPENSVALTKIINQLDPGSFARLARTCKTIHKFCFNTKEIKIIHDDLIVKVRFRNIPVIGVWTKAQQQKEYREDVKLHFDKYYPVGYTGNAGSFLNCSENRKKLRNYPFVYKVRELVFSVKINACVLYHIRSFLSDFPVSEIYNIEVFEDITVWNGFIQLVQDFHARDVSLAILTYDEFGFEEHYSMPDYAANYFLQNKKIYFNSLISIPDRLILNSPHNSLGVGGSKISKETFKKLVLRFANSTEDISWIVGRAMFDFGHCGLFKKVLPFKHKGDLPPERPLVFIKKSPWDEFFILRKDGKIVHCIDHVYVDFDMLHPSKYPPCLKSLPKPVT